MTVRGLLLAGSIALVGTSCAAPGEPSVVDPLATQVPEARVPARSAVDEGFAYDMKRHHEQAVEIAELVNGRTQDPEVTILARDIALTQQYQVGQMRGWLDSWGLPATSRDGSMTWMGTHGSMPGLATSDELDGLRVAESRDVDERFVQLMIKHHEGGIAMAERAGNQATIGHVRALASGIARSQRSEVDTMRSILERLNASDQG